MAHGIFHEDLCLVKFCVCLCFVNLHGLHTPGTCNFTDITVTTIQTKNMFQKDLLQPIEQSHKWEVETLKQKLLDVFLTRVVKLPCAHNNSSWMLQPLGSPV